MNSMELRMPATAEIMMRGMECLVKNLGVIEAETFISNVKREKFDYTEWQREYFDKYSIEDFIANASAWAKANGK